MKRLESSSKEIRNIHTRRSKGQTEVVHSVSDHYAVGDLGERILAALAGSGADLDALTVEDLAPLDALHIRGRKATEDLSRLARIEPGADLLDAGCGIGGTSRYLAASTGANVTGVDLTEQYIGVAKMLSERVGLADRTDFRQGSVLDLPFDEESFDVVWTEHVQMNVSDKAGFYGELYRVLRSGGTLAFHDIFAGPKGGLHFPVPWAPDSSISHLIPIEELRGVLAGAGFSQRHWEDKTGASTEFFVSRLEAEKREGMPGVGPHVVMEDPGRKFANLLRNLQEGRICVVQAVMKKPAGA
ncbi:MAG: class I SAM-dependent methyltransferase [Acidobacteria bacterium]|nr:class I SAM-dependent methyltransferase [Acidobacteriota bacterium]